MNEKPLIQICGESAQDNKLLFLVNPNWLNQPYNLAGLQETSNKIKLVSDEKITDLLEKTLNKEPYKGRSFQEASNRIKLSSDKTIEHWLHHYNLFDTPEECINTLNNYRFQQNITNVEQFDNSPWKKALYNLCTHVLTNESLLNKEIKESIASICFFDNLMKIQNEEVVNYIGQLSPAFNTYNKTYELFTSIPFKVWHDLLNEKKFTFTSHNSLYHSAIIDKNPFAIEHFKVMPKKTVKKSICAWLQKDNTSNPIPTEMCNKLVDYNATFEPSHLFKLCTKKLIKYEKATSELTKKTTELTMPIKKPYTASHNQEILQQKGFLQTINVYHSYARQYLCFMAKLYTSANIDKNSNTYKAFKELNLIHFSGLGGPLSEDNKTLTLN